MNSILLSRLLSTCIYLSQKAGDEIKLITEENSGLNLYDKNSKMFCDPSKKSMDPQTLADRRAQCIIANTLKKYFPLLKIIGEEPEETLLEDCNGNDLYKNGLEIEEKEFSFIDSKEIGSFDKLNVEEVIVWIDPLDGTREYIRGNFNCVTVLVGISYKGKPLAGVIVQPFSGSRKAKSSQLVVWGWKSGGSGTVRSNNRALNLLLSKPLQRGNSHQRRVVVSKSVGRNKKATAFLNSCKPNRVIRVNGCGKKMMDVLFRKADAFLFPAWGTKKWDTCAPQAILEALGGKFTRPDGSDLEYIRNNIENAEGFVATIGVDHSSYLKKSL